MKLSVNKAHILLPMVLFPALSEAQRTVVVYDIETRTPLREARFKTGSVTVGTTDYCGRCTIPMLFDTILVSCYKYLATRIPYSRLPDSIALIPRGHGLGEVVIYGEDPSRKLNEKIKSWINPGGKSLSRPGQGAGVSFDMADMLDFQGRKRAKRAAKVREAFRKMDEEDREKTMPHASEDTLKNNLR